MVGRLAGNLLDQSYLYDFGINGAVGVHNFGIQIPAGAFFFVSSMLFMTTVIPNSGGSIFSIGTIITPGLLGVLTLGSPAAPGNSFTQFGTTTGGAMDNTLNLVMTITGDSYVAGILQGTFQYLLP